MTDITLYLHLWQSRIEDLPVTQASVENAELELGGPRGAQISSVPGLYFRWRRTVTIELRDLERVFSFRWYPPIVEIGTPVADAASPPDAGDGR